MDIDLSSLDLNAEKPYTPEVVEPQTSVDRDEAFQQLAEISEPPMMNESGLSPLGAKRIEDERAARQEAIMAQRLADVQPIVAEISRQDLNESAKVMAIQSVTDSAMQGVHPEAMAVEELLHESLQRVELEQDMVTQTRTGIAIAENNQFQETLAETRELLNNKHAKFNVSSGAALVSSQVLRFMSTNNYNINEMLNEGFGQTSTGFGSVSYKDELLEAQKIAATMTGEQASAAVKRMRDYAIKNSGLFLENGWDNAEYMQVIESVFGSRVQAAVQGGNNQFMQWFDVLTLGATKGVAKTVGQGAKALGGKVGSKQTAKAVTKGIDDLPTPGDLSPTTTAIDDAIAAINEINKLHNGAPRTGMTPGTPAQVASQVAPDVAQEMLEEAVVNPAIAKRLGVSPGQIVDDTINIKAGGEKLKRTPSLVLRDFSPIGLSRKLQELRATDTLITPVERANVEKIVREKIVDDETVKVHLTRMGEDQTAYMKMDYVVGQANGHAFATKLEAEDFVRQNLNEADIDGVEILGYNAKTDSYEPGFEGTEFLAQVGYKKRWSSGADKSRVFRFDDLPAVSWLVNQLDTTVQYVKNFADGVTEVDLKVAKAGEEFDKLLAPVKKMSKDDQNEMWRHLKREELDEVEYTSAQLDDIFRGKPEARAGYDAVRQFYNEVWAVRNNMYRDHLQKSGYHSMDLQDGTSGVVRRYKGPVEDIKTVWVDEFSRVMDMEEITDKGLKLDFLESHIKKGDGDDGGSITQFVGVSEGRTKLSPLPAEVLRRTDGYLGRSLDVKYKVYKKGSIKDNGEDVPHTQTIVKVSNNPAQAEAFAAKSENLKAGRSREFTDLGAGGLGLEIENMAELGMLTHTKKRGTMKEMDASYKRALDSPEETLATVRDQIAKTIGMDEYLNYSQTKWMQTYGRLTGHDSFPWTGPIVTASNQNLETLKAVKEARIFRDKIRLTAGMDDSEINRRVKSAVLDTADSLARTSVDPTRRGWSRKSRAAGANLVAKLADTSPAGALKSLGYTVYINMNPFRQVIMQSGSAFMYAGVQHGSKYFGSGAAFADAMTLMSMKAADDGTAAPSMGALAKIRNGLKSKDSPTEVSQIDDMYAKLNDSGILQSISNHQFQEFAGRNSLGWTPHAGNYAGSTPHKLLGIGHAAKGSYHAVKRTTGKGFEWGESINRIFAFQAVYNKHKVNGTLKNMNGIQLGVEASQLAQNMGTANKAAFQTGNLSPLFQFQSHGVKMLQYMMFSSEATKHYAIPVIDNAAKARIFAWNTIMYGGASVGAGGSVAHLWDKYISEKADSEGIPKDSVSQQIAVDGFVGMAYANILQGITGTESTANISGTLSPLGGIFGDLGVAGIDLDDGGRITNPVTMGAKLGYEVLVKGQVNPSDYIGPGGNVVKTGIKTIDNVVGIFGAPGFTLTEKSEAALVESMRFIPMLNNAFQSRAMVATGMYADRYGNPITKATVADAFTKAMIGDAPDDVNQYYQMRSEFQAQSFYKAATGRELEKSGKDAANAVLLILRNTDSGRTNVAELESRLEGIISLTRDSYPGDNSIVVLNHMYKVLERAMTDNGTPAVDEMIHRLTSDSDMLHEQGFDGMIKQLSKFDSPMAKMQIQEIQRIKKATMGNHIQ